MIKQIAITAAALAALSTAAAAPASADEVGIGVGPAGVTVGTSHGPFTAMKIGTCASAGSIASASPMRPSWFAGNTVKNPAAA